MKTNIEQLESLLENAKIALELAQREFKRGQPRHPEIPAYPYNHPVRIKIEESIREIEDWEYLKRLAAMKTAMTY